MPFSKDILIRIIIFVLGLCGFLVARYIYKHKNNKEAPLVCPVGFDCSFVVHSDYSEFMHIPLEFFGMLYYALLALFYACFIFIPAIPPLLSLIVLVASFGACIFSVYLLCVQIFILKKGCSWCFVSAFISILIFILTVLNYDFSFIAQIFSK